MRILPLVAAVRGRLSVCNLAFVENACPCSTWNVILPLVSCLRYAKGIWEIPCWGIKTSGEGVKSKIPHLIGFTTLTAWPVQRRRGAFNTCWKRIRSLCLGQDANRQWKAKAASFRSNPLTITKLAASVHASQNNHVHSVLKSGKKLSEEVSYSWQS